MAEEEAAPRPRLVDRGRGSYEGRREADAAHDRLPVQARLAVVSARKLTTAELDDLFERALRRAKGDGHVANAAFAQLMALAHAALTGGDESTDGVNWADMTPEQRAVARVEIERRLAELAIEATEARAGDTRPGAT
jgi:hypothetical protein